MNDLIKEEFIHHTERFLSEVAAQALMEHDTNLESRVDDLESQASDHEDRIDMLDGFTEEFQAYEDRIEALETKLSQLDDISNILDRKIQQLLQTGRIKLYLAAEPPTQ